MLCVHTFNQYFLKIVIFDLALPQIFLVSILRLLCKFTEHQVPISTENSLVSASPNPMNLQVALSSYKNPDSKEHQICNFNKSQPNFRQIK